jgi:aminopeptidase N
MTLQTLRNTVGDEIFFDILAEWVASQAGGTVTTEEFIALAEKVSGQQLDELFEAWLFTPEKPGGLD